ncbi:MAG TPA: hypothetical protein GX506_08365 [Firmicutes bacterium]|nr:hypothetical protein [Bacillota bacterium]
MNRPPEHDVDRDFVALPDALPELVGLFDPNYFRQSRWFGDKDLDVSRISVVDYFSHRLPCTDSCPDKIAIFAILRFHLESSRGEDTTRQDYFIPLVFTHLGPGGPLPAGPISVSAPVEREPLLIIHGPSCRATVYDGLGDPDFVAGYSLLVSKAASIPGNHGTFEFRPVPAGDTRIWSEPGRIERVSGEYSNSLVITGNGLIHKAFRRLSPGRSPELEINLALKAGGRFNRMAPVRGYVSYRPRDGTEVTLILAQEFIPNEGDAWELVTRLARDYYEGCRACKLSGGQLSSGQGGTAEFNASNALGALEETAAGMGGLLAELHSALASVPGKAFEPDPVGVKDIEEWIQLVRRRSEEALDVAPGVARGTSREREPRGGTALEKLTGIHGELREYLGRMHDYLASLARSGDLGKKIRIHGDLHLGQWIKAKDGFYILDFEGEPLLSPGERRAKRCPLADVSGMLRSFSYASYVSLAPGAEGLRPRVEATLSEAFLRSYLGRIYELAPGLMPVSEQEVRTMLSLFNLSKALYELIYEAKSRPDWVEIPLNGVLDCLSEIEIHFRKDS